MRLTGPSGFIISTDSTTPITPDDVTMMPIPNAQLLVKTSRFSLESCKDHQKVVAWADSIVYQLGTPIPVTGKNPITELEFLASTYGDIEDVMSANG